MITIKNLILAGVTCLCISTVGGYAEAATPRAYKSSHKAQSSAQSLKSMFKNAIGKYPFDIKMLDKPALKSRLINSWESRATTICIRILMSRHR